MCLSVTCIDKASWRSFTELFRFIGQRDLNYSRDVTWWSLDPYGMRSDQLSTETYSWDILESSGYVYNSYKICLSV